MRVLIYFVGLGSLAASCLSIDFPELCFDTSCGADNAVFDCNGNLVKTCEEGTICRERNGNFGEYTVCAPPCGDAQIDPATETCDQRGGAFPEGCDPNSCQSQVTASCGNGVVDSGEICFQESPQDRLLSGGFFVLRDLDRDGDLDLFDGSLLQFNNGSGRFFDPEGAGLPAFSEEPLQEAGVGDLNGDGFVDLFQLRGSVLQLVFRRIDGSFERASVPLPEDIVTVGAFDLNNDGSVDLLGADLTSDPQGAGISSGLFFFPGDGLGGFAAPQSLAETSLTLSGYTPLLVADLDSDSDLDILFQEDNTDTFLLTNQGEGTFLDGGEFAPFKDLLITSITTLDINNDGALDIAAASGKAFELGGEILIFQNDGRGQFTLAQSIPQQVGDRVVAGDFDGDGATDLAVLGANGAVYRNQGGVFSAPQYFSGVGSRHAVGDLNGDGKDDIISFGGLIPILLSGD